MSEAQTTPPPASDPTPEPEPEGVVEVQGRRMVPVDALIAERGRVREATEKKVKDEYEPFKQKAEQLESELTQVRPHIEYLQKHPEVYQQQLPPAVEEPQVADEDAERFAREYELYTPTGLDLNRAKRMIGKNRAEIQRVAAEAAQQAVAPMVQTSAAAAARQNFVWAAQQRSPDGNPLVDPNELAQVWQTFPPELAANPDVARVILEAAIGRSVRAGRRVSRPQTEPQFTEAAGGGSGSAYQISDRERKMAKSVGLSEKDWSKSAGQYQPDGVNILGD